MAEDPVTTAAADLPPDPGDLVEEGALVDADERIAAIAALGDELGVRVLYAVLTREAPTVETLAAATGADESAVEAALARLSAGDLVAERMACLVDGEGTVYETTALARTLLFEGPIAVLDGGTDI